MARLDAARLSAWRVLQSRVAEIERRVDEDLRAEWDIPLNWFDVLAALQRLGGSARPSAISEELLLPLSSLTRRVDRLEEDGWVTRRRRQAGSDHRAVEVSLTRRGRNLWRAMNVTYRRSVQQHFAIHLDEGAMSDLQSALDDLAADDAD
jgi:DNA-binding MarR family transcriptional regulator